LTTPVRYERGTLSALIESMTDEVWFADADGNVTLLNPAASREFGAQGGEPVEAIAAGFEVYRGDGTPRPPAEAPPLRALRGETIKDEEEIVRTPASGELRHRLVSGAPVRDHDGAIIGSVCVVRDVTHRVRAEEALHHSEGQLRLATAAARIGVFDWDIRTGVNRWTEELEAMYGLAPGEFGKTQPAWEQLVHSDDRATAVALVERALETGQPVEGEWRVVWPDGSVRWISGRFQAFKDNQGRPVRLTGVNIDVTSQRADEEERRRSREDLDRAQAVAQIGSWRLDVREDVLTWSDENHRIFGLPIGTSLTYEKFLSAVHPDDRAFVDARWQAGLRGEPYDVEHRLLVEGQVKWVREKAFLEYDEAGELLGGFGITQDVTERKQAEAALRASEERFRLLFEGHGAVMLLMEPDGGQILDANPAAVRFYGYSREQLRAMHIEQINQLPPEEVAAERRRAADHGKNVFTFPHRLASGEVRIVEVYSTPVTIQGRQTLFSIIHDITSRRQAEEALEQTRHMLAEAQEIANVGSFEYVAATRTTLWSEEEFRIYGLDPAGPSPAYDVMVAECIHPDDAARLHEAFTNAIQSGTVYELEHRIVRPDGSVRWVYDRARPFFDDAGNLLRYVGATQDITERKRAEDVLRESEAERAAQLERARLARDLHDSVTQALFAATLKAEALTEGGDTAQLMSLAEEVRRLNRGALAQMRTLLLELRGDPLAELPIRQLLQNAVEATASGASVKVTLTLNEGSALPSRVHEAVYRITQEALNNVVRHAKATNAWVQLDVDPSRSTRLLIGDDGCGFDPDASVDPSHFGLRSMRERAGDSGGELVVRSAAGEGTTVAVDWPNGRLAPACVKHPGEDARPC
jgi:PAS domain S-box-containing protein